MTVPYRGRFAPTPSGPLHFGSLVAAVGSYLEAKSRGGQWHLRIDDLDPPRIVTGAADAILRALEAFGFDWDGPIGFQSARVQSYHAAFHQLRLRRAVYPCACSRREIAASAVAGSEGPIYPGICRQGLPPGKAARAWRLNVSQARVEFDDGLLGSRQHDLPSEAGDFVVYRADGVYAFHLASAVDDAEQGITDVVRGSDLLESSARQIYVQRVLGLRHPRYVHLPVAINAQGEKLSKQTHAAPLDLDNPVPQLCTVLKFLNQEVPADLGTADLQTFWRHAIGTWHLHRVGARLQAPAPEGPK